MNDDFNKTAWESLLFNLDVTMQTQWVMLFNAPVVITYMYKHYIFPYVVIEWNFLLFFFGDFTFTYILPANYLLAASLVRAESVLTQVLSMVPVFSRDLVTCRITRSYAILSDWYLLAVSKFWKWYLSEILPSKKLDFKCKTTPVLIQIYVMVLSPLFCYGQI